MVIVADDRVFMPTRTIADAAKAAFTRCNQGGQYRLHAIAESEIGETDDAGGHACLASMFSVALRGEIGDELDLTDGTHLDRPVRPIVSAAFDEDGRLDVVARSGIGQQLLDQIAPPLTPQVMVSVDDYELRLENLLDRRAGQPIFARWEDPAIGCRLLVDAH